MRTVKVLFCQLLILILVLEFSFYGLLQTGNNYYLPGMVLSTAGISYIVYLLFTLTADKPRPQKNYYLYFINDYQPTEDVFWQKVRRRL